VTLLQNKNYQNTQFTTNIKNYKFHSSFFLIKITYDNAISLLQEEIVNAQNVFLRLYFTSTTN